MRKHGRRALQLVRGGGLTQGKISSSEILVRKEGFEPPRPFGHKILSLARLPVPPLPQWGQHSNYTGVCAEWQKPGAVRLRETVFYIAGSVAEAGAETLA